MSDTNQSTSKYFSAMPEQDRLHYNSKTGTSNLIDWNKKMVLFMEALYGSKCSSVFREKALPKYMIGPYVPDKDLPSGNDPVALEARKLDYAQWFKKREEFTADLPKVISVLQTGTMTESSLQRIRDTREAEMDAAIKNQDVLEVLDIIWTSHQYRGRAYRVSDQRKVQREFAVFDYQDGESFVGLKRRFNELLEKMKNFSVIETDFNKMYQFLLASAKYPNSRISEQAMKYLGVADDNSKFPKSVNVVYDELISLEEVEAQIRSDTKKGHRDSGSVHMITGANNKSKAQQQNKSIQPLQATKQVLSAHSAVNKSLKKRFESKNSNSGGNRTNSSYPKNVATEAWAEQEMLRTGKSHSEVLDSLSPCGKCGKKRHMTKDCRAGNHSSNNSNKSSFNRSNSKNRFQKKAGVHAARADREDGEISDPEVSWRAHVFTMNGRGDTDSDMPELISNSDSSDVESMDASYRKYDENNNLLLFNKITRPFSGQIAEYHRDEGSTEFASKMSTDDANSLDLARYYGASIPLPVEQITSVNSVYAVYESHGSHKDIYTFGQSSKDVNIDQFQHEQTYNSLCPSKRLVSNVLEALQTPTKSSRIRSPPPFDIFASQTSSDTESMTSYVYTERDLDPPSDTDVDLIRFESELNKRQVLPAIDATRAFVAYAKTVEKVSPESSNSQDTNERSSPINSVFPFPDEEYLCLMISSRVMVRFVDSDALTSWILARESNIPEIRNRWRMATAFLNNGLEKLEDDEIGIVYDYTRGTSPRAQGVFLPDEDAEGFHLGPNGEFLERVRINGWLIAYGVSDFQFQLPNMQQTWNELKCVYGRMFSNHPFFNTDQSWNMYQDLLNKIQIYESQLNGSPVRHIWPFYNPITRSYTYNPEEWGSPTKIRSTWNNRSVDQSTYFTPIERSLNSSNREINESSIFSASLLNNSINSELAEEKVSLEQQDKPPDPPDSLPVGTEHVGGGLLFDINELLVKLEKDGLLNSSSDEDETSKSSDNKPTSSGGVHMAKHHIPENPEPYNNHTFYCLDSMANVSVFRNPDLLTDIRQSDKPLSIDGVGAKLTKVSQVGNHYLFGEVWYLPTNEYNIVSQWQAQKHGFLLKMSDDNKSCYLYRASDRAAIRFMRDPVDHFYKCPATDRELAKVRQAFEINAQDLHEAYTVNNHSMYYSQEQLRRADIVESLHVSLEHPSDSQLMAFIQSPSSINLPVTVQDVHNLRAIKGPCPICLEGRPKPHKGTHASHNVESEPTHPGELLHVDIVFVQKKPRLFAVDHVTGYMSFILMDSKYQEDLIEAFIQIINAYKSYLKVVRHISCDYESVLRSCETELNRHGVKMSFRIPGEHEKIAERSMRVVRERMRVKRRELPYALPKRLYDELAAECIRNINLMPNSKSMPHCPSELVRGEKINFLTDITPPFGSLVLCPVADNEPGTEAKQEVAVVLGSAGHNIKAGVRVYIPGKDRILIRRNIQPMSMTANMIKHMNNWANGMRGVDDEDFVFKDTIGQRTSTEDPFFAAGRTTTTYVNPRDIPIDVPEPRVQDQGVNHPSNTSPVHQEIQSVQQVSPEPIATPAVTIVPPTVPVSSPTKVPSEVPQSAPAVIPEITWPSSRRRRAPGLDPSDIIHTDKPYSTRGKKGASVNQMSLHKSLQSNHADAAILAAKKELKQLVDLKTWVYIKNRSEASPSVHTRETPCSMFLKQKYNSRGEFLLWKARLVDGGHRTDPTKYDPFEKTSPTISLEVVMVLLNMAVTDNLEIEVFDVPGAYLNASLQPGRFHMMRIAKGIAKLLVQVDPRAREYQQPDGSVLVEIRRSLYGLPEAAKLWNDYLTAALVNGGYQVCPHDPCLYVRRRGSEISIVGIYVDDCIHIHRGVNIYRELYASLRNANLHDLKIEKLEGRGSISFLGLNIVKEGPRRLLVNQSGYMSNLLDLFEEPYRLKPKTPVGEDGFKFPMEGPDSQPIEVTPYASKLMKVRYVERTRPDVSLALSILQTKMRSPTVLAANKLRRVVQYLGDTKDLGIIIEPTEMKLKCYCDAGFAVHDQRESQSGILFTLGDFGIPILWKSIKQKLVANSSTEAELICIYDALDHLLWIRRVLEWLGYVQGTTKLYQDNTSTITMAHMGRGASGSHTKHIDIRYFFIKQFIDAKIIEIDHLSTELMLGDFFASPRQGQDFRRTRDTIMGYVG